MLVSAIIPTYNRSYLICRAIESVLAQSYHLLELIIVDDGSTDTTEKVVHKYIDNSSITIKYFKKTNGGCSSARNKGVELASGEYIGFLDSDDQWLPNAISDMVETLEKTGADFVYSPTIEVTKDGIEQVYLPASAGKPEFFFREHFLTTQARPCAILYKKIIFNKLKMDEQLKYNEDSDFLQKVSLVFKAAYLPLPTAKVFEHDSNKSGNRVALYRALLASSENILKSFPEFAESLGMLADKRIYEIKLNLIEELLKEKLFVEASQCAQDINIKLRPAVQWALRLHSLMPFRIEKAAKRASSRLNKVLHFILPTTNSVCILKVMHVFHAYLHTTENWCFRLIKNLSDTQLYIVSEESLNEDTFHIPNAIFILKPLVKWHFAPHAILRKSVSLLTLLMFYFWRNLVLYAAYKADIIHAHFSFMGWNYLSLAVKTETPLAISFYGFDYNRLPNTEPVWKERYQELFEKAALFFTEGNFGKEKLIQMGCSESKVKVVHLGVEIPYIPYYKRSKKQDELKLVQVATFVGKKGYDVTIRAFIKILEKCPNITITLVGKDPEGIRKHLQVEVSKRGLDKHVQFIDGIDFSKLHVFLRDFHVFIHPSKYGDNGDSEGGAPIVLLDAQATGMPVLSTFHCDIPEEVINGVTGILVEENNHHALADAIETFYRMEENEYQAYCKNARKHVEQNYDAVKCAAELKKMYETVIA